MQKSIVNSLMAPHQAELSPIGDAHQEQHHDSFSSLNPQECYTVYKVASEIATNMESYSQVIDPIRESAVARIDRDEIVLGNLLGEGGFNNVFAVHRVDIDEDAPHYDMVQQERRIILADKVRDGRYAVKLLQARIMEDKEDYCNGAADLIIETKLLASLEPHRNIIQLHGVSSAGAAGFAQGIEGGYFLIVDRLQDTLTKRIQTWNRQRTSIPLNDRLFYAMELASALKHLHKFNIVFRDLKPDNVGFDSNRILKLFDFGLAKELNPQELNNKDTYEMSGQTGSRRYMAPEVARSKPYSLGADVYSFGVVLWQMCSLQEPFAGMSRERHYDAVVLSHERPFINLSWPAKIGNIMKWCWAEDQYVRPPMKEVHRALKRSIKKDSTNGTTPSNNSNKLLKKDRPKLDKTDSMQSLSDFIPYMTKEKNSHNMSFSSFSAADAIKASHRTSSCEQRLSSLPFNNTNDTINNDDAAAAPTSRTLRNILGLRRRSAPSDVLKAAVALCNAGFDGPDFYDDADKS